MMNLPPHARRTAGGAPARPGRAAAFAAAVVAACLGMVLVRADDTRVTKIDAETADSLVFQISVAGTKFRRGEDIPVDYAVTNKGGRDVYLVTDPTFTDVRVKDIAVLQILDPVVGPDPHEKFNYDFIKVRPRETSRGRLLIPAKVILSNKKYAFETAGIRVGFAYLFDISRLAGCKQATDTLPCLTEVSDRAKTLEIGTLMVEIK